MELGDVAALITSLGALAGSVVLFKKSRNEQKRIQTESVSVELNAIRKAYSSMLEDQINSLVKPMEQRIDRLVKQVDALQEEIDDLKRYRNKFEVAILYIRSLCHWIDEKDKTHTSKPNLPGELREYFDLNGSKLQ